MLAPIQHSSLQFLALIAHRSTAHQVADQPLILLVIRNSRSLEPIQMQFRVGAVEVIIDSACQTVVRTHGTTRAINPVMAGAAISLGPRAWTVPVLRVAFVHAQGTALCLRVGIVSVVRVESPFTRDVVLSWRSRRSVGTILAAASDREADKPNE